MIGRRSSPEANSLASLEAQLSRLQGMPDMDALEALALFEQIDEADKVSREIAHFVIA